LSSHLIYLRMSFHHNNWMPEQYPYGKQIADVIVATHSNMGLLETQLIYGYFSISKEHEAADLHMQGI
jgi:hypothetical protein